MASKKKQKVAQRKRSNTQEKPKRSGFSRIVRGLIGLSVCITVFGGFGSLYMRNKVVFALRNQVITSSSVVLSRAVAIARGSEIKQLALKKRLKRLGYRLVGGIPTRRGQYFIEKNSYFIFLRGGSISPQLEQREQLVRISTNDKGIIESITELKFDQALDKVFLEREILSLLGNTSTRASTPKSLDEIPTQLRNAVISIEDERFFSHFGIDPWAILRASLVNAKAGRIVQGGSTITQQLTKNLFRDKKRNLSRKIREASSALLIETAFSKEQILEMYLNEVFLGQEGRVAIHGFGEAARSFFDKDVSELSIAESALLAGIIKAPTRYSPRRYPKRAKERRSLVLAKMKSLAYISEAERIKAETSRLIVRKAQRSHRLAPYFIDYVRRSLANIVEEERLETPALQVYTGLDLLYQECAEQAVSKGLAKLEKSHKRLRNKKPPLQAALIATTTAGAEVVAWVGGRNYSQNQFDRVSQAKRQPGSAFKPFVYLTALDKDLNSYRVARATSILLDEPLNLSIPGSDNWQPQNYDRKFLGEVTVRQSLALSRNVPTVNLAQKVGIRNVARTAELFGFGKNLPHVPSLALGAGEVSPLELARAYAALANGGVRQELRPILYVGLPEEDAPIYKAPLEEHRISSEPATFVLVNILRSVVEHGTGRTVRSRGFTNPAAGKTGTSNQTRDTWFAGFTPRLLAVVWVGFDDNHSVKLTGASAAAPIWTEFMKCTSVMEPQLDFIAPPGVVFRQIDQSTGLLSLGYCPKANVVAEVFVEGTEPVTSCPLHTPRKRYGEPERAANPRKGPRQERQRRKPSFWDRVFDW